MLARLISVIALIVGVLVALGTGLLGLSFFLIGFDPNMSEIEQFATVIGAYAFSSALIGILTNRAWYLSLLSTWGPIWVGLTYVGSLFGGHSTLYIKRIMNPLVLTLVIIPLITIFFGFLGYLLRKKCRLME